MVVFPLLEERRGDSGQGLVLADPSRLVDLLPGRDPFEPVQPRHSGQSKGVTILREPHDAGFDLTFLAADPDGNLIRVAPRD